MTNVYYVFLVASDGILMAGKHQTFKTAEEQRIELGPAIIVKGVDSNPALTQPINKGNL